MSKLSIATKAFIIYNEKVLILRESSEYKGGINAGKYDVVGGRIKPGLGFDENLRREIKEETGLNVKIGDVFFVKEWGAVIEGVQERIIGIFFKCVVDSDKVLLSKDHDDFKWIKPEEYKNYNLIEDLSFVFENYLSKNL